MGFCISREENESRNKSNQIERYLADDRKKLASMHEIKLLLLGSGESGKSTIAKQMKIIHMNGYSHAELMEYKLAVYKNILECSKNLLDAIEKFNIPYEDSACIEHAEFIKSKISGLNVENYLMSEISKKMQKIWSDGASRVVMQRTTEFYIMDSAS
jgi:guanine nucleotide-binding protein G(i) subunit alpha